MDKVTRTLLLFSRLLNGEEVNKAMFCLESESMPRSFDRDIEDIRLFLSEEMRGREVVYDRTDNAYYLSGSNRQTLEKVEYLFIERVLTDTALLRKDEFNSLLEHLASNTDCRAELSAHLHIAAGTYREPFHRRAILKTYGDLNKAIRNMSVIDIKFSQRDGTVQSSTVIPVTISSDTEYICLVALAKDGGSTTPVFFRLDEIISFSEVRGQFFDEKKSAEELCRRFSGGIKTRGGEYIKITVRCEKSFYPYLCDRFPEVRITEENADELTVRLKAYEEGFVRWLLSQPPDKMTVLDPLSLKKAVSEEAEKILKKYKEDN